MKKVLLALAILSILLAMSCDNETMSGKDQDEAYLTITYHKDEGSIGEPPVDSKLYKPIIESITGELTFVDKFTIPDHGTLVKDGYDFYGWKPRVPGSVYILNSWELVSFSEFVPGTVLGIIYQNVEFDPVWHKIYP